MKTKKLLLLTLALIPVLGFGASGTTGDKPSRPTVVLYDNLLHDQGEYPELATAGTPSAYTAEGLKITGTGSLVRLDRYYALGERCIRYHVRFSPDAVAVFQGDKGEFKAFVDVPRQTISMSTDPVIEKKAAFIRPGDEYIVEIGLRYQTAWVRIIDLFTGESARIEATTDGQGGCGTGAVGNGFHVGRQYDYYCFGLAAGSELLVKQICVATPRSGLTLLMYGDSITEPDGYYPSKEFPQSWVQQILSRVPGGAVSSGRGGTTINELLERIKNELPYVRAKYVMVTIGTNGGNTEENLGELVEYILSQGSVPILNNIPSNESGTQGPVNAMIAKVREKYGIKGCLFDLATSVGYDGKQVDTSTMWLEDYGGGRIFYHHPNVEGSNRMYARTLIDVPEIYE